MFPRDDTKQNNNKKQPVQTSNIYETLAGVNDLNDMRSYTSTKIDKENPYSPPPPPVWNCHRIRPNFDELNLLIVKHNPLAVCLQETFLKDIDSITIRAFNLNNKFQETENRASGGVSVLVNENIPQRIVTLNTSFKYL